MRDEKNIMGLVRPNILKLEPYSTARDDFQGGDVSVWLDANENPYDNGLNRYPDPHQKEMKKRLAELKGVAVETIFIGGAGSDEAIDLTFRIFCEPGRDNAVAITPSYGVYKVAAAINNIELREVELGDDFSLPTEHLLNACDENTKLIWICSPNNPTGNAFSKEQILELASKFNGIVVVDEAYVDFSTKGSLLNEIGAVTNLIVLQTFSKAWGLASLRVGMAFADPRIARLFAMVKYPYNVNGPTQIEVLNKITSSPVGAVTEIIQSREMLAEALSALPAVEKVYKSDANFLLVKTIDADSIYDHLLEQGIIVRNRSRLPGCEGCLRITIGTPQENRKVIKAFASFPSTTN